MTASIKHHHSIISIAKAIAAYLVIAIHFPIPGQAGQALLAIARFSVPFSFAVSGYFFCSKAPGNQLRSIPRKIKKLLSITFISEICYFAYYALLQAKNIGFSFQCIRNVIDAEFWGYYCKELPARLLVFSPVFNGRLWFVLTLAVIYVLMYGVIRFRLIDILIRFSPLVLLVNLYLERRIPGIYAAFSLNRFILMMPLPFFMLGYAFRLHALRIARLSTFLYSSAIVIGLLLSVLEGLFHSNCILYFGTILTVAGVFGIAAKHACYRPVSLIARGLDHIGAKCSLFIYVMHPMIGWIISSMAQIFLRMPDTSAVYKCMLLVVVCVSSTVAAEVWRIILRGMKGY